MIATNKNGPLSSVEIARIHLGFASTYTAQARVERSTCRMEPDVHFVGLVLPGHGKSVSVNEKTDSEHSIWTLHITQFALGKEPSPGRNTVSLISETGEEFVLGTLEKDRCEQFQVNSSRLDWIFRVHISMCPENRHVISKL